LILRLTCPSCRKDSYSASAEAFKPCPYCGIVYSGKHGLEKRNEERIDKATNVSFSYKGKNLDASTLNISRNGLTVKIAGPPFLSIGDTMDVRWMDSNLKARIMWVMNVPDSAVTGLKILDSSISLTG
jgi:hypothetical protein